MVESGSGSATLRDGRRLAYCERGDPDGYPVLHHHGMPGSRLQHEAGDDLFTRLGVRLITPDRPGYGLSDPHPHASLVDWAEDVEDLMDSLEIGRFAMTALSGGGMYGLACAAALPDRVTGAVFAGCPAPMQIDGAFHGMRLLTRAGLWLGAKTPGLFELGAWAVGDFVESHPRFIYKRFNQGVPAADRRWISSPSFEGGAIEDLREAMRQGTSGYVRDVELLARPWGFEVEDVRVPVELWHGDADTVIPIRHAEHLAARIPGARLRVCEGEGHFLMWNHIEEILLAATSAPRLARSA